MRAGVLSVRVHSADCEALESGRSEGVFCAAAFDDYGKLYTTERAAGEPLEWEEDLKFSLGPIPAPCTLQVMLYRKEDEAMQKLLGVGSLCLDGLDEEESSPSGRKDVNVQLVNEVGKHSGNCRISCAFFNSRCPAKGRDELGRETIDPALAIKQSSQGARELNERSPQHSPRRGNVRQVNR